MTRLFKRSAPLAFLFLSSCVRLLTPAASEPVGPRVLLPLGESCLRGETCASGHCVDGVCCQEDGCSPASSCALPNLKGHCSARLLGNTCNPATAPCAQGLCTSEGVCCDSACEETCRSCLVGDSRGHCAVVPDNTDPRDACKAGPCLACQGGACLPALPATNNVGDCDQGMACNGSGACAPANGSACTLDQECASGTCLFQRCVLQHEASLNPLLLDPNNNEFFLTDFTHDETGAPTVLLFGDRTPTGGTPTNNRFFVARLAAGTWTSRMIPDDTAWEDQAGIAAVGSWVVTVQVHQLLFDPDCADGTQCINSRARARWTGPQGEVGGLEDILVAREGSDPPMALGAVVRRAPGGTLWAGVTVYDAAYTNHRTHVFKRSGDGHWALVETPDTVGEVAGPDLLLLGDQAVLFDDDGDSTRPHLRAFPVGKQQVPETLAVTCEVQWNIHAVEHLGESGHPLAFVLMECADGNLEEAAPVLAIYDPGAPEGHRLTAVVPPADVVCLDAWPVSLVRDTPGFVCLRRGGVGSVGEVTLWLQDAGGTWAHKTLASNELPSDERTFAGLQVAHLLGQPTIAFLQAEFADGIPVVRLLSFEATNPQGRGP